jgi:endonuclease YncB( thermonuclease family)
LNANVKLRTEELYELNANVKLRTEELDKLNLTVNLKEEKLELDDLSKVNYNVKKFTLDGMSMWGKVVHLYDGDTVHIVFIINNTYSKFICRIAHIDTPEMAPKNITDMNEKNKEKEAAIKSRNYLFEQVTDMKITSTVTKKDLDILCEKSQKLIWVKCFEFDKYGRLLVELYHNDKSTKSINMDMIDNNFALPYEGKTKEIFDSNNFS